MTLLKAGQQSLCQQVIFSATTRSLGTANTSNAQSLSLEGDELNKKTIEEKAVQAAAQHSTTTKTQAQMDEELRQKMMGLAGDGGEAGIEYEDGQPVAMKRSVKNNMFRYI
ncbi:hypothetical protein M433DRAFT_56886 [Acidomyces richmondensis BFW]|nr:MAG: hypothetical protein FE78DRAFT_148782 [Acidomyces sp. 'richmondensis']KYG50627.1 hypothetical protein M433DRAFT_56886 [Acidomyces richmondensis BFW]